MTTTNAPRGRTRLHTKVPGVGLTTVTLDARAVDAWRARVGGREGLRDLVMEMGRTVQPRPGLSRSATYYLELEKRLGAV